MLMKASVAAVKLAVVVVVEVTTAAAVESVKDLKNYILHRR